MTVAPVLHLREILRLKYERRMGHRGIARACGVGVGTVSEYVSRARRAGLNWPLPPDLIVFGEVGLSGEVRPVPDGEPRIKEAAGHGFEIAVVPAANAPRKTPSGVEVIAARNIRQVLERLA